MLLPPKSLRCVEVARDVEGIRGDDIALAVAISVKSWVENMRDPFQFTRRNAFKAFSSSPIPAMDDTDLENNAEEYYLDDSSYQVCLKHLV